MKTLASQPSRNNTLYSFFLASIIYAIFIFGIFYVKKNFTPKDIGLQTQSSISIQLNQFMPQAQQIQPTPIPPQVKPLKKKHKPKPIQKKIDQSKPIPTPKQEYVMTNQESNIQESSTIEEATPITAQEAISNAPSMLTFGKDNDPFLLAIKQAIDKNLDYPRKARMLRIEGTVVLEFTLLKNGEVKDIKILQSSGNHILDKSALKTIAQAQKSFPIAKNNITIQIPIQYHLES
ncbi:MAG: energy transducer TonB [Helicobacter sp.]|nr:energy transducer TonB [Helicobacter sp.]